MMARRCVPFVLVLVAFFAQAIRAGASPIVVTNFDSIAATVGSAVLGFPSITDTFTAPGGSSIGSVTNDVFFSATTGLYTYTHTVTPSVDNVSVFNTAFDVLGFLPDFDGDGSTDGLEAVTSDDTITKAGWSFSDAVTAGGAGGPTAVLDQDFILDFSNDNRLEWRTDWTQLPPGATETDEGWDSGEAITFFFQSTFGPGFGDYNMIDGGVGTATSYAPVPEPATLLLFGTGLLGCGALVRRRYSPRMG